MASKFKVGDKVRCLKESNYSFTPCDAVIFSSGENYSKVRVNNNIWNFNNETLELIEEEIKPLTNTIITDIKNQGQFKRVIDKLDSLGNKSNNLWYRNSIKIYPSGEVLSFNGPSQGITCECDDWNHITASEFLGEVDTTTKIPIGTSFTRHNSWYSKSLSKTTSCEPGILSGHIQNTINYFNKSEFKDTKSMNNNSIVNFFNDLTVSGDDKELRKAGLKNDSLQWTDDALQVVKNLEAKERGYKDYMEMFSKNNCGEELCLSILEIEVLFTKFYTKLLDTAKKFNRKDEKKTK